MFFVIFCFRTLRVDPRKPRTTAATRQAEKHRSALPRQRSHSGVGHPAPPRATALPIASMDHILEADHLLAAWMAAVAGTAAPVVPTAAAAGIAWDET